MVVRMKDIAAKLGLSVVTVSKALSDRPGIAKETRAKVLSYANRLNYRPNLMARSLATGQSLLIGLVVPDLVQPFFSGIAKGLSASLRKDNYFLIVSCSESDPKLERDEIERMLTHSLDCFVIASCQKDTESLRKIGAAGVPLILIDRSFQGFSCNFVGVNDYRIGELAAEHLLAQGYKRIAHIRGPETDDEDSRAEGYRDTIQRRGSPMRNDYVVECSEASDSDGEAVGRTAMEEVLTLRPRPDAVFCFNDSVAAGAMMKAFEVGMRIPRDMAILGCGNSYFSSRLRVPLSSIDQRAREIGERTAKLIAAILKTPLSSWPHAEILEPELIVRASSQSKQEFTKGIHRTRVDCQESVVLRDGD